MISVKALGRTILTAGLLAGAAIILLPRTAHTAGNVQRATDKISPALIEELGPGVEARVMVKFRERANLGHAFRLRSRQARTRFVYERLSRQADVSQAGVVRMLEARGLEFKRYRIVNAVFVTADLATVKAIARRPEVLAIYRNPQMRLSHLPRKPMPRPRHRSASSGAWRP